MEISSTARTRRLADAARAALRGAAGAIAFLLIMALLYFALALAGSLLPANGGWSEPHRGVRIFIYSNGVHTGIVVPAANEMQDWRRLVKAEDIADPRYALSSHMLFGWGERNFYLHTPRWSDLKPGVAASALFNGRHTLLHVDHVHAPRAGPNMRPLTISNAQYRRLTRQFKGYFRLDPRGRPQPIRGYGPADVFYESRGHYDAVRTCNEWTGAQLRDIGVRIGFWTPFSQSVMRWFP